MRAKRIGRLAASALALVTVLSQGLAASAESYTYTLEDSSLSGGTLATALDVSEGFSFYNGEYGTSSGSVVSVKSGDTLTLVLVGENDVAYLYTTNDLTISGEGALATGEIYADTSDWDSKIYPNGESSGYYYATSPITLTVESGKLVVEGEIRSSDRLEISGGDISAYGIRASSIDRDNCGVDITGGKIDLQDGGIYTVSGTTSISGGEVTIESSLIGIFSTYTNISGGKVSVDSNLAGWGALATRGSKDRSIVITGGDISVSDPNGVASAASIIISDSLGLSNGVSVQKFEEDGFVDYFLANPDGTEATSVMISASLKQPSAPAEPPAPSVNQVIASSITDSFAPSASMKTVDENGAEIQYTATVTSQGEICKSILDAYRPEGYVSAYSFNILENKKEVHDEKSFRTTIDLTGGNLYNWSSTHTFAVVGIDEQGIPYLFEDLDDDPTTITVDVDITGYAFELIYEK